MEPSVTAAKASDLRFQCNHGQTFGAEVFDEPATAELATTATGALLRAFLTTPEAKSYPVPQHGWWLVAAQANATTFVARIPGEAWFVDVSFERSAGRWKVADYGSCQPSVVLAHGLGPASWTFDGNAPGAGDTEFKALVLEMSCASGQSAEGRIVPPTILYEPERILVIIAVRPPPGPQTCQGNPQTPYVVHLAEPIGNRRALDGSFAPPHDPTQPIF
jgi:hypothetical protein